MCVCVCVYTNIKKTQGLQMMIFFLPILNRRSCIFSPICTFLYSHI